MYTSIGTAEGEAWRQARQFGNPNKCANWTMEWTPDDLDLLTRQNIPNDDISIVTCTM
jgi:hypothetical protein